MNTNPSITTTVTGIRERSSSGGGVGGGGSFNMCPERWLADHPCALTHFEELMSTSYTTTDDEATNTKNNNKKKKQVCVFLDYDGTLSPIVNDPDKAVMSEDMRRVVDKVSTYYPTSIISGRALEKVKGFVQLEHLYYAGSHGLDIEGPKKTQELVVGSRGDNNNLSTRPPPSGSSSKEETEQGVGQGIGVKEDNNNNNNNNKDVGVGVGIPAGISYQPALDVLDTVNRVRELLIQRTCGIKGVLVEDNKFCCSVHFRNCGDDMDAIRKVQRIVEDVVEDLNGDVQMKRGRKVFEVRPSLVWNKGNAVSYLLDAFLQDTTTSAAGPLTTTHPLLQKEKKNENEKDTTSSSSSLGVDVSTVNTSSSSNSRNCFPLYLGDDKTDEDAFRVINDMGTGVSILVSTICKETCAQYTLKDPQEVQQFLTKLANWAQEQENTTINKQQTNNQQ